MRCRQIETHCPLDNTTYLGFSPFKEMKHECRQGFEPMALAQPWARSFGG